MISIQAKIPKGTELSFAKHEAQGLADRTGAVVHFAFNGEGHAAFPGGRRPCPTCGRPMEK